MQYILAHKRLINLHYARLKSFVTLLHNGIAFK